MADQGQNADVQKNLEVPKEAVKAPEASYETPDAQDAAYRKAGRDSVDQALAQMQKVEARKAA